MAQKLYTEEQVIKAFMAGSDFVWDDKEEYTQGVNEYVKSLTPIELPSDEEAGVIALNIASTLNDKLNAHDEAFFVAGFQTYSKWMRDKILNK